MSCLRAHDLAGLQIFGYALTKGRIGVTIGSLVASSFAKFVLHSAAAD